LTIPSTITAVSCFFVVVPFVVGVSLIIFGLSFLFHIGQRDGTQCRYHRCHGLREAEMDGFLAQSETMGNANDDDDGLVTEL
jgi:hypothetical protein